MQIKYTLTITQTIQGRTRKGVVPEPETLTVTNMVIDVSKVSKIIALATEIDEKKVEPQP